ncbi:MAG: DUF2993 domain-containing protein [Actinomycetota bacterium]|nr:DUF2993 domain-containing protein [Actinomycetota bacterium]
MSSFALLPLLLEKLVAQELQSGLGLAEEPQVEIRGDLPLGALAGEFEEGQVTFANPELLGGVRPDGVTVALDPFDLDVLGSVVSGRLRAEEPFSGELRIELSEEEIAEIATSFAASPVREVELEEGRFVVGSEVELLGIRVPVSVEWELDVRDGVLRFEPVRAKALGEPVPEELLAGASFEYPIGELPFEGELSSVEIREDRLVLVGRAEDLPVG